MKVFKLKTHDVLSMGWFSKYTPIKGILINFYAKYPHGVHVLNFKYSYFITSYLVYLSVGRCINKYNF